MEQRLKAKKKKKIEKELGIRIVFGQLRIRFNHAIITIISIIEICVCNLKGAWLSHCLQFGFGESKKLCESLNCGWNLLFGFAW